MRGVLGTLDDLLPAVNALRGAFGHPKLTLVIEKDVYEVHCGTECLVSTNYEGVGTFLCTMSEELRCQLSAQDVDTRGSA